MNARSYVVGSLLALLAAFASVAHAQDGAQDAPQDGRPCLKPTDPVAGELRKVTTRRPTTRELVTNWHIVSPELLCINTGETEANGITDIQVVFAKSVDLKKLDGLLGMSIGVKGKFVDARDDGDTGIVVVLDAKLYDNLDDSGMVRRQ